MGSICYMKKRPTEIIEGKDLLPGKDQTQEGTDTARQMVDSIRGRARKQIVLRKDKDGKTSKIYPLEKLDDK